MRNISLISILAVGIFAASCQGSNSGKKARGESQAEYELKEIWRTDTLLRTPESVIYDTRRNRFYVSNLNMEPRKKDGNGFISVLTSEGKIETLRWIEGLSSPKGMVITGDTLIATDVDELVLMSIEKGEIISKIPVKGSGMLNDITKDKAGRIYFSDTDSGKISILKNGEVNEWLTGVKGPNGLLWHEGRLLVATQGSSEFYSLDPLTMGRTMLADSVGRGDGIAFTGTTGTFILTDWTGEIFIVQEGMGKRSLLKPMDLGLNTADVEFLQNENILLVPTFFGNCIIAYKLAEKR